MAVDLPGRPADTQLLGYSALMEHYGLECPPPRRLTAIAAVAQKVTVVRDGVEWLLLPKGTGFKVSDSPIGHLGAALKHEGVDLRVLSRLFACDVRDELCSWISAKPAGLYTRRAWFLYEWLTNRQLPLAEPYGLPYQPALDPMAYVTARPSRSARHKIDNNMPGLPGFCPLIRRTERLTSERMKGLADAAAETIARADPGVLRRAVGYMLLNESKGSFGIEGETPPKDRLERWGRLIAEAKDIDLSLDTVERLHRSLFEKQSKFTHYGYRTDDGFVGRHDRDGVPIPDHVSARPQDVQPLLGALLDTYRKLVATGFEPLMTAAVIGFGFVFIHPFEDGNGRLHRFVIQKALVDTGFSPPGVILPVSAAILEDLLGYRAALEDYSNPTLRFIDWTAAELGNVAVTNETNYLYRYFDATRQAEYFVDRIEQTVRFSLPAEIDFLHKFDALKRDISAKIDLSDRFMSLFIQFCAQNGGELSKAKHSQYFGQMDGATIDQLEHLVQQSGIVQLVSSRQIG